MKIPEKIPLKFRANIIQLMHRRARPMTAGEISLYFSTSIKVADDELIELAYEGKVIKIADEDTERWILTERPSVKIAGDDESGKW